VEQARRKVADALIHGKALRIEGGAVFLDEIGDISPAMQVRLLRVLQERTYEPLSGTHTRHADVRVIAATHRDLVALIRTGTFREDLFYRLNVPLGMAVPVGKPHKVAYCTSMRVGQSRIRDSAHVLPPCHSMCIPLRTNMLREFRVFVLRLGTVRDIDYGMKLRNGN